MAEICQVKAVKRTNHLFPEIISFENILAASQKARRGKRFRAATAGFELNLEKNLFKISEALKQKTWQPGAYTDFMIHDPKTRLISAAPYFDRVIHHALINVIEPVMGRSFIPDTYACIQDRGTYRAVERYKTFQKKNRYVLKCDIQKYFQSIDHDILFEKIRKKIKCRDTLWLVKTIIDSRSDDAGLEYFDGDDLFTPVSRKKGIPIGNLTSQFFANLYLNDFDHFILENVKPGGYIRYCDDFVVFENSKKRLGRIKEEIINYLGTLRLRLHRNKSRVYRVSDGVDFLGFRIFPDHMRVRKRVVKTYRKKLEHMMEGYRNRTLGFFEINNSIQSWIGHVSHADSYGLRTRIFEKVVFKRDSFGAGL